jgi:hypothetical protein
MSTRTHKISVSRPQQHGNCANSIYHRQPAATVKPVLGSGFTGPSNINISHKQASQLKKMLCHAHMARVQLGSHFGNTPVSFDELAKAAQLQPQVMQVKLKKEVIFTVIWDSGASQSITFDKRDFVGPIKSAPLGSKLSGMAKGLNIAGMGHVVWCV